MSACDYCDGKGLRVPSTSTLRNGVWKTVYDHARARPCDMCEAGVPKFIVPFSNGTDADMWTARNCERCDKAIQLDPDALPFRCEIQEAIQVGAGHVTVEIAKRMRIDKDPTCGEFYDRNAAEIIRTHEVKT